MSRNTRDLLPCELVVGSHSGRGKGTFAAKVSRFLRLGYKPLGSPHYTPKAIMLVMILEPTP